MRPGERDEVGAAGGEDGVDLIRRGDVADAHGGDPGLVPDLVGKGRLEHAAEDRLRLAHGLPGRDVDEIDTGLGEGLGDEHRIVAGDAAFRPVGGRDADRHGLM